MKSSLLRSVWLILVLKFIAMQNMMVVKCKIPRLTIYYKNYIYITINTKSIMSCYSVASNIFINFFFNYNDLFLIVTSQDVKDMSSLVVPVGRSGLIKYEISLPQPASVVQVQQLDWVPPTPPPITWPDYLINFPLNIPECHYETKWSPFSD